MKNSNTLRAWLIAAALILCLSLPSALAADRTWSGGGGDNNWSTANNWGGIAPVNNDDLIFTGSTQPNNTNDISNLTIAWLRFVNGGFTLNGNLLTLNPGTAGIITNLAGTNIIANNLSITPAGKYWSVAAGSELRLTGAVTNTAATGTSVGWLCLTNGGTVRIMNSAKSTRGMDLFQGTVIVDGGLVDASNDGICLKPPTGSKMFVQLTNNGTIRIGGGGNFRMGNARTGIGSAAGPNSTSQVDLSSGTVELYGANVVLYVGDNIAGAKGLFNQNGGLVWGSAGSGNTLTIGNLANADGTYNLNGGVLWIAQVRQGVAGATNVVFNFNGGTLKPTASSTTFFQGLLQANVQNGGAIIDTTNLNITIAQNLVAAGAGGLTKLGSGTLVLSGTSTYAGATVVSNGTLVVAPGGSLGASPVLVSDGATLSLTNMGSSLSVSSLTMGSAGTSNLKLAFPSGNPASASIVAGNLVGNGNATINITASGLTPGQFPLVQFTTSSGLGNFHLGAVPPGVSASLVQTANTLALNISSIVKSIAWTSAANNLWNTSAINWADLGNGNNPTNYAQSGGFGDEVTFDDSASGPTAISLALAVTPVSMTFNNSALSYSFSGAGKISGVGDVTLNGFQTVTFGTANDYSGGTTINAGTLYAGADQALGSGPVTLNQGTLASDSATTRTLSNPIILNANNGIVLGDTVNSGALTLPGRLDLGGGNARVLNFNSDVIVTGSLTNGGLATKTGPGRLIIKGNSQQIALATLQQGDVIVDGGRLDSLEGWRVQNFYSGTSLLFAVTNGGVFTMNTNSGNLRIGLAGGDNSSDNVLDISGTVNLTPALAIAGNSAVSLGLSGANDYLRLRAGGLLLCRAISGGSPAYTEVDLYGGTLMPIADEPGFFQGVTNAFMEDGGLTVDTTNFNVTISQALLAAGGGGLAKAGTGTLTLMGADTYTGPTAVNAGKLVLGPAHAAPGGITVASNATLAFMSTTPGVTVFVPGATTAGGAALEAQFTGVTNNPTSPAGLVTNLVLGGPLKMNLVAANIRIGQFPLIGYGTISGAGSVVIGQLPQGVVGSIVTNAGAKTLDLVVSSVTPIIWKGAISGNWDTSTTNWTLSGSPTVYAQGDNVRFDDSSSNSLVTMTVGLTPGGVTVSNSALSYQLNTSGAGSLGGSMSLVKDGTNSLALNSANSFAGTVTVKAGTVIAGNATALGAGTAATTVQSGGALDVNGNNLGLQPVVLAGSGPFGLGALNNSGADQNNALRDVTLTADAVVRADALLGIRMPNDTDPGFRGNGYKLTKTGSNQVNLNGGQTNPGTTIWDSDLGDVSILQGTLSFQRRMMMGRVTNSIGVAPGATLLLFALNTTMPVQVKPVYLTNATLSANGNSSSDSSTFAGPITLASGSNFMAALTGVTLELLGPIAGAGDLYLTSNVGSTVALGGTNTYTGATVIQSGTLALEGTALLNATPSIQVAAGATLDVSAFSPWTLGASQTLGGNGMVNGSVQASGAVSPGPAIGTLTFYNDLTLAGTTLMELNKDNGLTNDLIVVSGNLAYGGTLKVVLTGSTALAVNDTFQLFSFANVPTGSFAFTLPGGYTWDTTQLPVNGTIKVTGIVSPRITTVSISGTNLMMAGSGGSGGAPYYVLSSTNVTLALAMWSPIQTNSFAADGSFTTSLPVLSTEPKRFYTLQAQ